jgi:hypothetical protein
MSTFEFYSRDYPEYKESHRHKEYLSCNDFLAALQKPKQTKKSLAYTTRNGRMQAPLVHALLHHPIPAGVEVSEPKVTS